MSDEYGALSAADELELRRRQEADREAARNRTMNALIRAEYRRAIRERDGLPPVADRPGPAQLFDRAAVLRARRELEAEYPGEVIGAQRIADKLGCSRRTVQRRLEEG